MGTHPFVKLALIGDSLGCTEGDPLGLLAPFESMLSCVAITLTITGNATVDEGSVYTLNIAASGDDAAGITGYAVNWGDGSATEAATAGDNTHTYDDGPLNASIVVTALHPNGNKTASKSVTVGNVVPTATITGDSTATVDVAYTATISSVTDPGDDTVSTYRVYWGDGSSNDYASAGAKTHTYTASASGLTVRLDLIDEDGTHTNVDSYSLDVSATVTPIHSLDLTAAPAASNSFDDYGLSLPRTVTDYNGRIVQIPADAVPMGGLRVVRNLNTASETLVGWTGTNATISDAVTVVYSAANGYIYKSLSGLNTAGVFVFSATVSTVAGTKNFNLGFGGASSGVLTATTTPQRFSFAGTPSWTIAYIHSATQTGTLILEDIQIQDITHRADLSTSPDEFVSTDDDYGTGVNGFRYFDTELANTVASNVVTEGTGASIEGWLDYQPDSTNLLPDSAAFETTASWNESSGVITTNQTTGPDGTSAPDKLAIEPGKTAAAFFTDNVLAVATDDYTASVYVKAGSISAFTLRIESANEGREADFDLAAETASSVVNTGSGTGASGGSAWIEPAVLGFYRCVLAGVNVTTDKRVTIAISGNAGDYIYAWGAQLETGTVPTAYIPTSGGSASRPAMSPAPTISGLTGTEDARLVVKGLAADLVTPDPTDTTERTLDVDNTDGEFDTLPSPIKVLSIDVYNDGERPD